ncbi:hypothetical protein [Rathayibacter sp. AY1C1]|uniref:hypothetical protein n=1 Tax=Rathayibacter sp. AY1C1 TaxID=2080534 RepID=UPI0011B06E6B|nr:hypothetical protein [Rathayibacter sp. AY1C1]
MTAAESGRPGARERGSSGIIAAGALMLASAGLQQLAAVQRWAVAGPILGEQAIEDHRYDYSWPSDPWENVGSAAQLLGIGHLLVALAVLAAVGPGRRRPVAVLRIVVAAAFGCLGLHAVLSGILGAPTILQAMLPAVLLGLAAPAGLLVLAVLVARTSPLRAASFVLLIGSTLPGYLVATFAIAPALVDYQSYDTTPWTESVVAASVALAGAALLLEALIRSIVHRAGAVPRRESPGADAS